MFESNLFTLRLIKLPNGILASDLRLEKLLRLTRTVSDDPSKNNFCKIFYYLVVSILRSLHFLVYWMYRFLQIILLISKLAQLESLDACLKKKILEKTHQFLLQMNTIAINFFTPGDQIILFHKKNWRKNWRYVLALN